MFPSLISVIDRLQNTSIDIVHLPNLKLYFNHGQFFSCNLDQMITFQLLSKESADLKRSLIFVLDNKSCNSIYIIATTCQKNWLPW